MDPGNQAPTAGDPHAQVEGPRRWRFFRRALDREVASRRRRRRRSRRGRRRRQAIEPQRNLGVNLRFPDRERDRHRLSLLAAGRRARQPPAGDRLTVGARERDRQRPVRLFRDGRQIGGGGDEANGEERRQLLFDLSRRRAAPRALNLERQPRRNDETDHRAHSIGSIGEAVKPQSRSRRSRAVTPARPRGCGRRRSSAASCCYIRTNTDPDGLDSPAPQPCR